LTLTPIDDRDPLTSRRVDACLDESIDRANDDATGEQLREAARVALRARLDAEGSEDQNEDEIAAARAAEAEASEAFNDWLNGERDEFMEEYTDTCLNTFRKETLNARQLQIGIAYHDSQVDTIDESGSAAWVSYAFPLAEGSLTTHARISDNVAVPDAATQGVYQILDKTGDHPKASRPRRSTRAVAPWVVSWNPTRPAPRAGRYLIRPSP